MLLYLLDEHSRGVRPLGGASKWWLDKSLRTLSDQIKARGGRLILRSGAAETEIPKLVKETGAEAVFWNRRYGHAREIDARIKSALKADGVEVTTCNGGLLVEPFDLKTGSGGAYKVFTPFWRALQATYDPGEPHPEPRKLDSFGNVKSEDIDDWNLHPTKPDWSAAIAEHWTPGEAGARKRLRDFLNASKSYADNRDIPEIEATSRLSPHLHFGEIGPAQVWRAAKHSEETGESTPRDIAKFLSELGWRDFSHHLLYHDPAMTHLSWRREFENVAWRKAKPAELKAWKKGQTGYPIVDAGLRELWATGYMHNRVRMIVASFLTKDILAHWRIGEEWFWDTLVDADEAANANNWQWVAGTGADAAPYFRVFNPVLQGEKFDPKGAYVRKWAPELANMPDKFVHHPWDAGPDVLAAAGVTLGETYPKPMLDHGAARERALAAYAVIKTTESMS